MRICTKKSFTVFVFQGHRPHFYFNFVGDGNYGSGVIWFEFSHTQKKKEKKRERSGFDVDGDGVKYWWWWCVGSGRRMVVLMMDNVSGGIVVGCNKNNGLGVLHYIVGGGIVVVCNKNNGLRVLHYTYILLQNQCKTDTDLFKNYFCYIIYIIMFKFH